MRGLVILVLAAALVIYGFTRPVPPFASTIAQISAQPTEVAKSEARPEPSHATLPRQLAPLDITPRAQRPTHSVPASGVPSDPSNAKQTAAVLTAAAIAALVIAESRRSYHSGGRPCACPDDRMRNGRACGGRSAYSRPGGAAPLCYPADVTEVMIKAYRARQLAER